MNSSLFAQVYLPNATGMHYALGFKGYHIMYINQHIDFLGQAEMTYGVLILVGGVSFDVGGCMKNLI